MGRLGRLQTLARHRPLPSSLLTSPPSETAAGKPARRRGRWRRGLPLLPRAKGLACRGGGPGQGGQRCPCGGRRLRVPGWSPRLAWAARTQWLELAVARLPSVGRPPDLDRPAPTPSSSTSSVRSGLRCGPARRIRWLAAFWRWGSWDRGKPLAGGGGHNDDDAVTSIHFLKASLRYPTPHPSSPASR